MNLKIFETPRLRIRPSVWDDVETFFQWEQQPAVTEFFSIRDGQTMEETARKFLKDQENPNAEQFTILLKAPGLQGLPTTRSAQDAANVPQASDAQGTRASLQKIGRIVLADIERGWKGELWRIYIADSALRGQGLGREAMRAMMEHCFRDLALERLYLDHYTGNPAAYLYQSLGFQYEGVLRRNCRKNGVLYDVHLMSMLREEYEEKYGQAEAAFRSADAPLTAW